MTNRLIFVIVNICRLVVSAIFFVSGFVKLIDPHGVEYKIHDYLTAMHLDTLLGYGFIPLVLAVFPALLEFCLGVYLFIGMRRRTTLFLIILLLLFYTPLTLWLAITDAVADCGCFGDAVKLTNWQTFYKNVFLVAATLLLWFQRRRIIRIFPESAQWLVSVAAICSGFFLAIYCLRNEPIIDFRPFHVGQHIPSAMEWPDDPSALPEILDFEIEPLPFESAASQPVPDTYELLADSSYTFLLTAPHLEVADDSNMEQINALYDYAAQRGYRFLALTSSSETAVTRWRDLTGAEYDFAFMDELTLKTIARSNPALLMLCNGTIIGKWGHNQLPSVSQIKVLQSREP